MRKNSSIFAYSHCAVRNGITQTSEEIICLTTTNGRWASALVTTVDGFKVYMWKMGKSEAHYRKGLNDKHSRRWVKRHLRKVVA